LEAPVTRPSLVVVWVSLAVLSIAGPGIRNQVDSVDAVLDRARNWLTSTQQQWGLMVCDEEYEQEVWGPRDFVVVEGDAPVRRSRRRLKSEFVFVWIPTESTWTGFRDVAEVDGRPIPDRGERMRSLLGRADASLAGLAALANESARFNIGPARRNFNEPSTSLLVFAPIYAGRFRFKDLGDQRLGTRTVRHVSYEEIARPTLINRGGRNAPIRGELWIDPQRGWIVRTRLKVDDPARRGTADIVVDYQSVKDPEIWMPATMTERYESGTRSVVGKAVYTRFRKFETDVRLLTK
jgi:hypothetical protein